MSDQHPSQIYSTIKWACVITFTAVAINTIAPNVIPHYYFIKKDEAVFRGNTLTGRCERLAHAEDRSEGYYEWLDITK
jgi:hypothetical protein